MVTTTRRTNARSNRTRATLRQALLALAEDRDFDTITVSDVSRLARVNRSTFYLHYPDRDALVADALDVLFADITSTTRTLVTTATNAREQPLPAWEDSLFDTIGRRPGLFRRLLASIEPGSFGGRLLAVHEHALLALWARLGYPPRSDGMPPEAVARFAAAGLHGLILSWLESGMADPPDTIARWVWNLSFPDHQLGDAEGEPPA